jgi:hypothetical protein
MSDVPNGRGPEPPPWNVMINEATGEAYRPAELLIDIGDKDRLVNVLPDGITIKTKDDYDEAEDIDVIDYEALGAALDMEAPPNTLVIRLAGDPAEVDAFLRAGVAGEVEDELGVTIRIEHNTVFMADAVASPVWASPVWASPVWASPVWASPVWASGATSNNALPVHQAAAPQPVLGDGGDGDALVIILDTGLADLDEAHAPVLPRGGTVTTPDLPDLPDSNGDFVLDPVAGHGTFIAGLVELATPGAEMIVCDVMEFRGDTAAGDFMGAAVGQLLGQVIAGDVAQTRERFARIVIGMSFAGPMSAPEAHFTRERLDFFRNAGIVVVAAAGNLGTCDRQYPAAFGDPTDPAGLENVVSVGALGRCGPAPFTNYGSWVRACADGEMLTSSFFSYGEPHGAFRQFNGWARWSGTSFSVGVVIGALVREMRATGDTALDVVGRLVDDPALESVPNLGTIIN